ncbi:protoglobin domain-containing protein [Plectonema radiosum NIES-515]|jgi:hypothetical protein|uniref:Protoglobin domain-containing protein n=1 Tax=Plectonema radiosum NIES-515 TaxID=2986073 RepID=A0ABT3B773_9CYAN|nr:protoglobin domain-containing protein [Plectonema radiosum]MCV3217232.1 protoglobin domain-containing protein [Plectonema radiosum NIES-515]
MAIEPHAFMSTVEKRIGFTDEDKALLNSEADWGLKVAPEMADHFYAYLGRDVEMNAILNVGDGRIDRLRETFIEWFHEMFTGMDNWGKAYADRRWKIGLVHFRIGIEPQHVVPAMATVVNKVDKSLKANGKSEALKDSLSRVCMIDLAFIEQAYLELPIAAIIKETGWSEALFRRIVATGVREM